jgi:SpoVK/Ycf46/Vps4 family AAA+-type ATPase
LLFDRIRELQELSTLQSSLHMAFTGRPGTGKTSVATKIALVLRSLGTSKGHVSNVTREDLVGQYVGHTAQKQKNSYKEHKVEFCLLMKLIIYTNQIMRLWFRSR